MVLTEMFEDEMRDAYQDPSQDSSRPTLKDLRKTKLTLRQINRLRMMSDVRRFERFERLKTVRKQYGVQPQTGM